MAKVRILFPVNLAKLEDKDDFMRIYLNNDVEGKTAPANSVFCGVNLLMVYRYYVEVYVYISGDRRGSVPVFAGNLKSPGMTPEIALSGQNSWGRLAKTPIAISKSSPHLLILRDVQHLEKWIHELDVKRVRLEKSIAAYFGPFMVVDIDGIYYVLNSESEWMEVR